ncbi:copper chaperone PCu(A)C [Pacificibacter sp. AS14]|uniref:copper chaperone PCu(A)C n=1 Tax=Pacificibacter sp. AS14 TaxID=3135785 RepID=UPI00317B5840
MTLKTLLFAAMLFPLGAFADSQLSAEAWIPTPPPMAMSHAAYVTLHNTEAVPRVLIGVSSDTYAMSHLHETKEVSGMSTMSMLHQIEIPAGETLTMQPGGLHIMLMSPKQPVAEGDSVMLTLSFANGETLTVDAMVKARDYGS